MAAAVAWEHCAARRCLSRGCSPEPIVRRLFGCDGDGEPGYLLDCWRCHTTPSRECSLCHGTGEVRFTDCPARLIDAEVAAMHEAFSFFRDGILPVAGGMQDQSATFIAGARMLRGMYALHEKREMKVSRKGS